MQYSITDGPVVGLNVPAAVGMRVEQVSTPCLIIDMDKFESNLARMASYCESQSVRLRAHAKTHKSADIARRQIAAGACGVCCQKVSEAEALASGGVTDILISNQVCDLAKIDRLASLARTVTVGVCVDDMSNVAALSEAAVRHGSTIQCLVEVNVGANRCGVAPDKSVNTLAAAIQSANGLTFQGLQAYQGSAQHIVDFEERKTTMSHVIGVVQGLVESLANDGLSCATVAGAGTGTFPFEAASGVYNELQAGSYIFLDADYNRVQDYSGDGLSTFENALFVMTSVMSVAIPDIAICDAGLKAQSVDSGMPQVAQREDVKYLKCSDEHGVIGDPGNVLSINDRLMLIPGHCDPTCNLHDWYVCVRDNVVESVWPVTARGLGY
jgi:3-hydroxy-D-aspartate aldolase